MSKLKTETVDIQVTDEEKQQITDWFSQLDPKLMKAFAESISMMVRAFEGRPVEPDDIITRLTNVKNILERSRFPTYALLAKQVYLRLVTKFSGLEAFAEWADLEAAALISYKGLSRQEYTEQMKAASGQDGQTIMLNPQGQPIWQPTKKKHWWRRSPKEPEETEFINK